MSQEDVPRNDLDRVVERLEHLETLLQMQTARLYAVEQRLGVKFAPPPVFEETASASPDVSTPNDAPQLWEPLRPQQSTTGAGDAGGRTTPDDDDDRPRDEARPYVEAAPPADTMRRADLETRIGGKWFNWIGIIAFTFGVAFFLKYAFDNEWIGPSGRVVSGIVVGVGFLLAGERLRVRGLASYAYALSGGGILILYLSVYAAFAFYQLVGQVPAFLAMAAVTATAVLLSVRYSALPIAVLGLIGGFLTPLLLSTGRDNQVALFAYIALLDAGVLALAYFKQWRSLDYMAFVATVLMQVGWLAVWYGRYGTARLWPTVFFLTLFFLMFSMLAMVHNVLKQRRARWSDISLLLANATFYFATAYSLLDDAGYDGALGSFALVVSAFYILLFYATYRHHRADRLLRYSYLGSGITFLTMAVAIQLDQQWVTIGWATEAVVLTWIGLRSDEDAPRLAALGVFTVALTHWFGWDMLDLASQADGSFIPLLNRRAVSCAALVGAFAGAAWLYRRAGAEVEDDERSTLITVFVLAANVLALTLLTVDVNDYFEHARARAAVADGSANVLARLRNTHLFALSILWTLYGATALVLGILRRMFALRVAALALLGVTIIKVLALDAAYYGASWHVILFNQTFIALAMLVASLAACAWVYARSATINPTERAVVAPVLFGVAHLLAVAALSFEALGYFDRSASNQRDLRLAQQLSLSVIWTIYGGVMLVFGLMRRNQLLRVMSLALLGVTTLKVFFWDLASLDRIYRIISFILLGAILLAVSYIYQRRQQRMAGAEESSAVKVFVG